MSEEQVQGESGQVGQSVHREPPVNEFGRAYDPDASVDERSYALWMHLSLLAHLVISVFAIAIPIIMWQVKKEESSFLDDHGREALNFQITLVIYTICLVPIAVCTLGVGAVLILGIYILAIIGMIQASTAANRGEFYRYPMTMRFV